jgi:hypothetical protein
MSMDGENLHELMLLSPVAQRMRLYRQRRRKGLQPVRILLNPREIETLVQTGYLEDQRRSDRAAIQLAAVMFISDALFEGSLRITRS